MALTHWTRARTRSFSIVLHLIILQLNVQTKPGLCNIAPDDVKVFRVFHFARFFLSTMARDKCELFRKVDRLRWIVFLLCALVVCLCGSACWIWHKQTRSRASPSPPNINEQLALAAKWRYYCGAATTRTIERSSRTRSRSMAIFPACLPISIFTVQ